MQESKRIRKVLIYTKQKEALKLARFNETDFTRKSPLNIENLSKLLIFKEGKTNQMEIYNFFNRIQKPELCVTKSALTEQRKKTKSRIIHIYESNVSQRYICRRKNKNNRRNKFNTSWDRWFYI